MSAPSELTEQAAWRTRRRGSHQCCCVSSSASASDRAGPMTLFRGIFLHYGPRVVSSNNKSVDGSNKPVVDSEGAPHA